MALKPEQTAKFKSYDQFRRENFTSDEIAETDREVALEVIALDSLQESVSKEVAAYMGREGIGFNELTRRLGTSTRQTSRLLKGQANLTMASIAEVGALIGKKPKVTFE